MMVHVIIDDNDLDVLAVIEVPDSIADKDVQKAIEDVKDTNPEWTVSDIITLLGATKIESTSVYL